MYLVKILKTFLKILIKHKEIKKLKSNRCKMKHLRHLYNARTIKLFETKVNNIIRFKKVEYYCDHKLGYVREKEHGPIGDYHFI
jgi:hypothetical protein